MHICTHIPISLTHFEWCNFDSTFNNRYFKTFTQVLLLWVIFTVYKVIIQNDIFTFTQVCLLGTFTTLTLVRTVNIIHNFHVYFISLLFIIIYITTLRSYPCTFTAFCTSGQMLSCLVASQNLILTYVRNCFMLGKVARHLTISQPKKTYRCSSEGFFFFFYH